MTKYVKISIMDKDVRTHYWVTQSMLYDLGDAAYFSQMLPLERMRQADFAVTDGKLVKCRHDIVSVIDSFTVNFALPILPGSAR